MKITDVKPEKRITLSPADALIIVDIQNDFLPGGALAVSGGHEIIEGVNAVSAVFEKSYYKIILTQDWHPLHHNSFASAHPGKQPFDQYATDGIGPVLWPDHCVQGQKGADFSPLLNTEVADAIIRKGLNPKIDSYSTFIENDKKTETGLGGYLKSLGITRIFICGLALDYCVYFSAIDGRTLGFEVYVIIDLTRGIDDPAGSINNALEDMTNKGIKFVNLNAFLK
ncbi:MAG TPA: bifunctional nicotinamidase/pyrazinamidase [Candidatus Deferrimicrobium sp.]|nr:bifunctional nicotinamidase/pyrazinamidase [Candidatus Deferrimicrobium sp.]